MVKWDGNRWGPKMNGYSKPILGEPADDPDDEPTKKEQECIQAQRLGYYAAKMCDPFCPPVYDNPDLTAEWIRGYRLYKYEENPNPTLAKDYPPPFSKYTVTKVDLEKLKFCVIARLTKEDFVGMMRTEVGIDDFAKSIYCSVHSFVMASEVRTFMIPKTWWDAFKARWFPLWLLKRFPLNMECYSIADLYPGMRIDQSSVRVFVRSPSDVWNSHAERIGV